MVSPSVSVVMGLYNGEAHLPAAVESILGQEGVDLELIVVDDGSTDGSSQILQDYAARDPRVRVIHQVNQGLTKALIRGCDAARGEFIARQDADDLSLPGRLAAQQALLRDPQLAFVSSWAEVMGPRGEPLITYRRPSSADAATRLLLERRGGPPGHGSVMFRKAAYQAVGGYRPQLYYAQDSDLWLRLALVGGLNYVPRVLYRYRIAADSLSGSLHPYKVPFAAIVDELHAARLEGRPEAPILERASRLPVRGVIAEKGGCSRDMTLYFVARCLARRHDPRALGYLVDCLRVNPRYVRAWLSMPLVLALTAWRRI